MDGEIGDSGRDQGRQTAIMTLRVIVLALGGGVLGYAALALVMVWGGAPQPAGGTSGILTITAIALAPVALVASRIVPAWMARNARWQIAALAKGEADGRRARAVQGAGDPVSFAGTYQTKTLVAAALVEGAAFLAITVFLIERSPLALGIGIGLALVILAMYPTDARVDQWISQQQRLMEEEQMLKR